MSFSPAMTYDRPDHMYPDFATTPGEALVYGQLLKFGANNDTITGVMSGAGDDHAIAVCLEDVSAPDNVAGKRVNARLLGSAVVPMRVGGAITLGTKVVCQGATGRVIDIGAAANTDARQIIGIAMGASSVAGDLIPVLVK